MTTKVMEAAKEITNLREIEMYTAEEIAAIISKHFPEPSVSVSELEALRKQRDAALKLADEILIHRVSPLLRDSEWVMGRMDGKRDVANKIRAIFEPKEEK